MSSNQNNPNIIVIGDVMLDINYFSVVERNAPEANIPIYNIKKKEFVLGGAANVARNLNNLNANIELISVIGDDDHGEIIKELLERENIRNKMFIYNDIDEKTDRKTTQKHRIIYNNNIVTRFDIEDTFNISSYLEKKIFLYITKSNSKKHIDAIIISDYDKGIITENLCQQIIKFSNDNNIYTFVDPKIKNYQKYRGCFCLKPNMLEAQALSGTEDKREMFEIIKNKINNQNTIITDGKNGIYVNSSETHICHENEIEVVDVTGAGDIVLSVITYLFIKYKDILLACQIANDIAGHSVKVLGNYKIPNGAIESNYLKIINKNKNIVFDCEIEKLKLFKEDNKNKKIVFTNGCFDIIHSAHLKLLNFCKKQGDILVVGLNSDESIKRLKGDDRPINNLSERCELLLNLNVVDYIVVFQTNTPYEIIKLIQPNILIKGGDYTKETIVGADIAEDVIIFDYISNKSTTLIVNKIKNSN
jgi:D-beta-D-heptose 7-phosphate kinase/D-beta-D-heptose 1-phosphate adenosyltransferase